MSRPMVTFALKPVKILLRSSLQNPLASLFHHQPCVPRLIENIRGGGGGYGTRKQAKHSNISPRNERFSFFRSFVRASSRAASSLTAGRTPRTCTSIWTGRPAGMSSAKSWKRRRYACVCDALWYIVVEDSCGLPPCWIAWCSWVYA